MSTRKLHGVAGSRAIRSLWAIEEVGVPYEQVAAHFIEDSKKPEYLVVNPNGRIPALVDGDLVIFESMAINLHLARTYGAGLYPTDPDDLARTEQWSIWAISEIEPYQMAIVVQKFFTPEEKRSERAIESSGKALARPLAVLDAALADRDYLLGDTFTIADLNVSAVMLLLQMIEFDLSPFPNVQRWTGACYARPALAAAQARD